MFVKSYVEITTGFLGETFFLILPAKLETKKDITRFLCRKGSFDDPDKAIVKRGNPEKNHHNNRFSLDIELANHAS